MKNKESKMIESEKKIILVAGMGMTPAVLTETVWALAHQTPAVVPDEIVVITTSTGKTNLQRDVMKSGVWKRMCEDLRKEKIDVAGKLILGTTSFQVIPNAQGDEIDDLRTGEDNLRAADTMLKTLRQYTDSSDTVVLASIAGGRKTMSALLLSCMSLVGRPEDRVYHVLTASDFEGRMDPPFFYPEKGVTYKNSKGKSCKGSNDVIELFEVPFVRMGGVYREKYKKNIPSYWGLVNQIQSSIVPEVEIDVWNGGVKVGGRSVRLSATEFATLLVLALKRNPDQGEIYKRLYRLQNQNKTGKCDWLEKFVNLGMFSKAYDDDPKEARGTVADVMCNLRKKFEREDMGGLEALVPKYNGVITCPKEKVTIVNDEKNRENAAKVREILDKAFA